MRVRVRLRVILSVEGDKNEGHSKIEDKSEMRVTGRLRVRVT